MFSYSTTPQSIGKVLDNMFRLYGATIWKVVWISLVAAIFSNLPSFIMPAVPEEDPDAAMAAIQQVLWILPVTMAVTIYCYAAMFYRMHQLAIGGDTSLGAALRAGLGKLLPLIAATLLYLLAVLLGLVALVIPGILLGLSLYFFMPLIVIDNLGIISSLKSSHRLVWRNWWRTAAVFAVPMFIVIAFYGVLGLVAGITIGIGVAAGGGGETELVSSMETFNMVSNVVVVLFSTFLGPLFSALLLAQLHDLKLRREGSDLEARLAG